MAIDPGELEWNSTRDKKKLPLGSGCYVVMLGERCLYVGKAHRMRSRFYQHLIEHGEIGYHKFEGELSRIVIHYTLAHIDTLKDLELALIEHYKPELNKRRR